MCHDAGEDVRTAVEVTTKARLLRQYAVQLETKKGTQEYTIIVVIERGKAEHFDGKEPS